MAYQNDDGSITMETKDGQYSWSAYTYFIYGAPLLLIVFFLLFLMMRRK